MTTIWRSMILQPRMMISLRILLYLRCGGQDIWVHADYIRTFEFADKFYAEYVSNPLAPMSCYHRSTGSCRPFRCCYHTHITDISYIAARKESLALVCVAKVLCTKKPVIFYSNNACWLFVVVEEGFLEQSTFCQVRYYETCIWTLVDSVDTPSGLPTGLITHGTQSVR